MSETRRAHTGRKRNEAAREAILDAAMRLLTRADGAPVTVDTLAAEAGVGKQTIYRWWSTKGEVFLEAMNRRATATVPTPDSGELLADLETFIVTSFAGLTGTSTAGWLRSLAVEAAANPHMAGLLSDFTRSRREVLEGILRRGRERGELGPDADLGLMVDQVYGVLWYRLLLRHRPLDAASARSLARTLVRGNAGEKA